MPSGKRSRPPMGRWSTDRTRPSRQLGQHPSLQVQQLDLNALVVGKPPVQHHPVMRRIGNTPTSPALAASARPTDPAEATSEPE